jgi:hypothetical protein
VARASRPAAAPAPTDPFAATTASASKPPRSRKTLWIGSALVLVPGAAIALFVLSSGTAHDGERTAATSDRADRSPAKPIGLTGASSPPDAAVPTLAQGTAVQPPAEIALTVQGAPARTEVFIGKVDRGALAADGVVRLERGDADVELVLRSPGLVDYHHKIRPDHDQTISVQLAKAPRPQAHRPAQTDDHDSHDVIHVFGEQ